MRRALHAEWTKLVTVPAHLWTLAAVTAVLAAAGVLVAATQRPPDCGPGGGCAPQDITALVLSGVYLAQLAALAVAVALVSGEYQPRVILLTLAARPGRGTVLLAKAAVATAAVLVSAVLGVAAALAAGHEVLSARGFTARAGRGPVPLSDPALLRAAAGTVLYLVLVGVLALGAAWVLRHQAAAVGAVAGLLYGPFVASRIVPMPVHVLHAVQDASPMSAGLAAQSLVPGTGTAPIGPWSGLAVLAAWAAAALSAGWLMLERRDG
ncbi:ABC transporter permease subunit [Actinacidiphila rubida]|uniref:ABC-2 type transport system permease protein n=1 Tax=Actinacidiphila rubida TaxID=310780 RepID=A0A1H8J5F2_9ACTN|nr:ABC transporter permease subunit [Actinacidiphila rubida]SEN75437.1 ABC-2 type transport system permease protein [Actinacidiphila rubida]